MSTTASFQFLKKNINDPNKEEIIYPITLTNSVFRIQGVKKTSLEDELLKLDNIFNANSENDGRTPLKNVNIDCANGANEIHNLPYESLSQTAQNKITGQISNGITSLENTIGIDSSFPSQGKTIKTEFENQLTNQINNLKLIIGINESFPNKDSSVKIEFDNQINKLKQTIGIDDTFPSEGNTVRKDLEAKINTKALPPQVRTEDIDLENLPSDLILENNQLLIIYEEPPKKASNDNIEGGQV